MRRSKTPGNGWRRRSTRRTKRRPPPRQAGEGSNESVSTDSHEELPVLQASDWEEDNERSVRRFGYNPDSEVSDEEEHYGRSERRFGYNPDNGDPWAEYQGVMGDDLFAW
jgi:hypothetical protein